MKKQIDPNIKAHLLRSAFYLLLLVAVGLTVALSSAINLPNHPQKFLTPQNNTAVGADGHASASSVAESAIQKKQTLTFADRIAYQRAIEDVYWQHRIWPKENAGPKPSLDEVMLQPEIEKKVEDYLRNSQALEDYWQRPITPDQLQAEMERIASRSRQPGVLRELFAALGNDPFVIAECLARPVLAERLLSELYAHDQRFHGELKQRAEAELRTPGSITGMKQTSGMYTEIEWIKSKDTDLAPTDAPDVVATPLRGVARNVPQARGYSEGQNVSDAIRMNGGEWEESVQKLAGEFGSAKAGNAWTEIKTGVLSPLQEDDAHYYAVAVTNKGKNRWKLATIAWLKEPLRSWLAKAETQVPTTMAAVTADYTLPVISGESDASIPSDDSSLSDDLSPLIACTDDTWTATSVTNAPGARGYHTAVWTGSEMIVWGGYNGVSVPFNTGGRYNPSTDSWTATSTTNAPAARAYHTAVWTGSEMIVWGGQGGPVFLNTGGRYNPSTNSWTATSTTGAPTARGLHTAIWTGDKMIVWGGSSSSAFENTGGRYNPSTNSWTATSTTNAPEGRDNHTAVWSGTIMIVWGGSGATDPTFNTGGRYNPSTDSWTATSITNAPTPRLYHTAVWAGTKMIVWGGDSDDPFCCYAADTGGRYDPGTNSWIATTTNNAPEGRFSHTAVSTGSEMIVWGGSNGGSVNNIINTGGRYNPSTDSWTATSTTNAPDGKSYHTAVWTGTQMIVWGGYDNGANVLNTGGRYCAQGPTVITNPATNVAAYSATLNGSVNPGGLTTTVHFQYGTTTSYGLNTANQSKTGNTYQSVVANISGLSASTTYHFRIVATNSSGTFYGNDRTFTTLSATGPPVAITNAASYIASFSARLNGSVDPHGLTTTVHFQYGTTTSYGLTTAPQSKTGNTYQNVVANISGLTASTTYHFRIVATNSSGTRYGRDRTFTTLSATGAPVVITNLATNVASSSATLNGSVDPHGLTTTVHFQYGTTTSYGHTTANQTKTGNAYQNMAANISGLTASTRYHFRIVATNSAGTRYGSDRTFATQ